MPTAKKFNFLFLSTDDISIPTLKGLTGIGNCLAVVTTPPRPRGRGKKILANPVDTYARENGLDVIYAVNLKDPAFVDQLRSPLPDFLITFSFPFILPKEIITISKWPINVHPSLLPHYRGPAPIRWAIIKGEKKTGITTIVMNEKVDAGPIVDQIELEISPAENYGDLRKRISLLAPEITIRTVQNLLDNLGELQDQNGRASSYAPKITKEMTTINWNHTSIEIVNLIRGLSPSPGARTRLRDKMVKILSASTSNRKLHPGQIMVDKKSIMVGTGDGSIELKILKVAGSREISGQEFINGFHPDGENFH